MLERFLAAFDRDDAGERATIAGAHLFGIAVARYILEVEPLASMDRERLVRTCAPAIDQYLGG